MSDETVERAAETPACGRSTEPESIALALTLFAVVAANGVASATTGATINLMGGVTPFALEVREYERHVLRYYGFIAYLIPIAVILYYLAPLIRFLRRGSPQPAPLRVQQRTVNAPLVVAGLGFAPWLISAFLFPLLTVAHFGRWSGDLSSQQVLSPLVNGFLAAATSYLLMDWVFRRRVIQRVFPGGRPADVPGSIALSVRGRLFVFLVAVAFLPLFTFLGLVRAAAVRIEAGLPVADVMQHLSRSSQIVFAVYVFVGVVLTWMLAKTLTGPLEQIVAALRRVQNGETDARVDVTSTDELGVVEDGVNAMVEGLRERERILQTFGRVVEPSVRDHLLAGAIDIAGEVRVVSVLFCDLRGFTHLAEHTPADDLVLTLNEYFTAMTLWVRECGGYVDKFIGDAVLVVFGLFEADAYDGPSRGAAAALSCALGMRDRLETLNADRAGRGRDPLAMKIGLHTGEVVAGTIGARDRHEFTVIGDTVNVAARLERLCKQNGCDLLISESTLALARRGGVSPRIVLHDSVVLQGREQPVSVYGVAA
jgi:adenylate cyclase